MRSNTPIVLLAAATAVSAAVIPGQSWNPSQVLKRASLTGQATYYGGNVAGGACSFSTYTLPSGIFGTALSDSNWANSAECGACVSVTGPSGNSITAMIVDECPGCGTNHLDLFPTAFTSLAAASEGVIDVTWSYTDCPITTPLQLHNKEGVSAYWFSMQVVNANQAVESLEVSTDGGSTWTSTTRQTYNFFENESGFGTTTVDVRVTSSEGEVVVVNDVTVSSGESVTASSNFGSGSSAVSAVAAEVATSSSAVVAESTTAASTSAAAETTAVESSSSSSAVAVVSTLSSTAAPAKSTTAATSETSAAAPVTMTSSTAAAVPTTLETSAAGSKTTSVIYVTVTGSRPGATIGANDSCPA